MLGKENLKKLFHECKGKIDIKGLEIDVITVKVYQHFNGELTKDNSKEIALCLAYNYGFLYK